MQSLFIINIFNMSFGLLKVTKNSPEAADSPNADDYKSY